MSRRAQLGGDCDRSSARTECLAAHSREREREIAPFGKVNRSSCVSESFLVVTGFLVQMK
eukprot:3159749-Alexandrium_andersonii.AAC.1